MNEHTLDDLAARLAALGWGVSRSDAQIIVERDVEDGLTHRLVVRDDPASLVGPLVTGFERMVHQGEEVYHIGVEIPPETLTALSLIRQWQVSAEPAPPPAAPVVTITDEMIQRAAEAIWKRRTGSDEMWAALAENYRDMARVALDAALDDADAPGGG